MQVSWKKRWEPSKHYETRLYESYHYHHPMIISIFKKPSTVWQAVTDEDLNFLTIQKSYDLAIMLKCNFSASNSTKLTEIHTYQLHHWQDIMEIPQTGWQIKIKVQDIHSPKSLKKISSKHPFSKLNIEDPSNKKRERFVEGYALEDDKSALLPKFYSNQRDKVVIAANGLPLPVSGLC